MRIVGIAVIIAGLAAQAAFAQNLGEQAPEPIVAALKELSARLADDPQRGELRQMLGRSLREQIMAANQRSSAEWAKVGTREDWERFRAEKLKALRASLGSLPERPGRPKLLVTGAIEGDGFRIQNLVYESRPGLVVTANLYVPDPPRSLMPGILLSHSHHNPKHEGELQDMGMTWARAGCYVLVPDHLGHGERRQHPFASAADYDGPFQVGRQDYYFRYDTSLQLYLVGESLMGWMVNDLMTGVDVLLSQPGIDAKRIVLLGSVAGGGDPAGVTAALDERIACVVPFNFGGPQPENRYPLPDDAEQSFNYAGGGSWESTRNLARSAADGFLPWVIVGSIAPRKLVHAHEFSWDRERDPVWKRYQRIWGLYDEQDNLAFTHGFGTIQNTRDPASHCNNIGAVHRKAIHEAFRKWFAIDVKPQDEYKNRRTREELTCLTEEAREAFQPKALHKLLSELAATRLTATRAGQKDLSQAERRQRIVESWTGLAADAPFGDWSIDSGRLEALGRSESFFVRDIVVRRGDDSDGKQAIARAIVVLPRPKAERERGPIVIALAEEGAAAFLKHRQEELAILLQAGAAVALVEVTGTGSLGESDEHGQQSGETANSATQMMLGRQLVATQLRLLRSMLSCLRMQFFVDDERISVWAESFSNPLAADAPFNYPRRIQRPTECTPSGPLLAQLFAASDPHVAGVFARGSLVSHASMLDSPFVQVPHACCLPGSLAHGDMVDLIAAIAPKPIVLERFVDARNRRVPAEQAVRYYADAQSTYASLMASEKLVLRDRSEPKRILDVLEWRSTIAPADRALEFSNRK